MISLPHSLSTLFTKFRRRLPLAIFAEDASTMNVLHPETIDYMDKNGNGKTFDPRMQKQTIIIVINDLQKGGAEMLLVGILPELNARYNVVLVTLRDMCDFRE